MKKSHLIGALCAGIFIFLSTATEAALWSRLGGQAYFDTDLGITWLADANAGAGSVYDDLISTTDGRMSWAGATNWATNLAVEGVTGWRLPVSLQPDPSCDAQFGTIPPYSAGANCTGGEMPHLYNVEGVNHLSSTPFTNVKASPSYWTGTDLPPDSTGAMQFDFNALSGSQGALGKTSLTGGLAWAVRDGDVLGLTQLDPILPNSGGGGIWSFTGGESGNWFDPPTAGGYTYTMDGGSFFTDILGFPTGFISPFEVLVGGSSLGFFNPGQSINFGTTGVASFTIQGINPLVDPDDPSAFPLQLKFSTATADFTMSAVPIPAALWLFGSGLLGLVGMARRKKA